MFTKKKADYVYHNSFRLAGVTYNNDDGSSRQEIIQTLKDGTIVGLKPYQFNNNLAIGVYTCEGKQIGNIKEKDIPYVMDRLKTMVKTEIFNVRSFYYNELNEVIFTADVIVHYK